MDDRKFDSWWGINDKSTHPASAIDRQELRSFHPWTQHQLAGCVGEDDGSGTDTDSEWRTLHWLPPLLRRTKGLRSVKLFRNDLNLKPLREWSYRSRNCRPEFLGSGKNPCSSFEILYKLDEKIVNSSIWESSEIRLLNEQWGIPLFTDTFV